MVCQSRKMDRGKKKMSGGEMNKDSEIKRGSEKERAEMRQKRGKINKRAIVNGALCQTLQDQQKLLILTSHTHSSQIAVGFDKTVLYKHMLTHTLSLSLSLRRRKEHSPNFIQHGWTPSVSLHRGANGHKVQSSKVVSSVK